MLKFLNGKSQDYIISVYKGNSETDLNNINSVACQQSIYSCRKYVIHERNPHFPQLS